MKELKITHNENLCLTSQCLNKIDDKKFFFALRVSLEYEVSGIDVGDITEVRIRSARRIQGQAGWELRKVQYM